MSVCYVIHYSGAQPGHPHVPLVVRSARDVTIRRSRILDRYVQTLRRSHSVIQNHITHLRSEMRRVSSDSYSISIVNKDVNPVPSKYDSHNDGNSISKKGRAPSCATRPGPPCLPLLQRLIPPPLPPTKDPPPIPPTKQAKSMDMCSPGTSPIPS
jgi:hypothetical protein